MHCPTYLDRKLIGCSMTQTRSPEFDSQLGPWFSLYITLNFKAKMFWRVDGWAGQLGGLNMSLLNIRGGVAGPAGPAKSGPLFRGSLVSFSDCSDSLRTRRLGVCVSRNRSRSFAGGSGARRGPNGLHQHPRILIPQVIFTAAHCLL